MTARDPWSPGFAPPEPLVTGRFVLEPLAPAHAELDFAALMSSRARLRRVLPWNGWPRDDFTLEENRADLARHYGEFERREAYAYTVLAPDRATCLGCIYLAALEGKADTATLMYWVTDGQLDSELDEHLVTDVATWLRTAWPFDGVALLPHRDDPRGIDLATRLGLTEQPASPVAGTLLFTRG